MPELISWVGISKVSVIHSSLLDIIINHRFGKRHTTAEIICISLIGKFKHIDFVTLCVLVSLSFASFHLLFLEENS